MVCPHSSDACAVTETPAGVFFLFGQGRLSMCRGQPAQAIEYYQRAVAAQDQYKNLHYVSH